MSTQVSPALVWSHALSTLLVIITRLPLALGLIAERAFNVGVFDPTLGGDPHLLAWTDANPWSKAVLLLSLLLGLVLIVQLARDTTSKRLHLYHAAIGVTLCLSAFTLQRTPSPWVAATTTLLALLYLGFWSRRLMDPDSR